MLFYQVSVSGTSDVFVQLGTSSGFIVSGYLAQTVSTQANLLASRVATNGFNIYVNLASRELTGAMTLRKYSSSIWFAQYQLSCATDTTLAHGAGHLNSISGTIDRIRAVTNGTDTFDKGQISLILES